jgi:hypothetical protein
VATLQLGEHSADLKEVSKEMPIIGGVMPNQSFEINGQAAYVMNLTDANNEPCFLTFNASSFDQFFE